jgi:hypothetical protein
MLALVYSPQPSLPVFVQLHTSKAVFASLLYVLEVTPDFLREPLSCQWAVISVERVQQASFMLGAGGN